MDVMVKRSHLLLDGLDIAVDGEHLGVRATPLRARCGPRPGEVTYQELVAVLEVIIIIIRAQLQLQLGVGGDRDGGGVGDGRGSRSLAGGGGVVG